MEEEQQKPVELVTLLVARKVVDPVTGEPKFEDFNIVAADVVQYAVLTLTPTTVQAPKFPARPLGPPQQGLKFEVNANVSTENVSMYEKFLQGFAEIVRKMKVEHVKKTGPKIITPGDARWKKFQK